MQSKQKKNNISNIKLKIQKIPTVRETVQATIPIKTVHDKANLIESYDGCYTRTYEIANINYQTASEPEQESILTKWRAFLNSLGSESEMQLTIFNRNINMRQFEEDILLKETGDGFDYLRRDFNKVLLSRITEGKNGISKNEYITLSVHADSVKNALDVFHRLDNDINEHMKKMDSSAKPVNIVDRIEILHDIYNLDNAGEFNVRTKILGADGKVEEITSFDFDNIRSQGLSVADIIAPSSMEIFNKYMEIGNQYVSVLKVMDFPSLLEDTFLSNLTNMSFNMITTLNIKPFTNQNQTALINKQLNLVREEISNKQKDNIKNNIDVTMISEDIKDRETEVIDLRNDIRKNDEHLFEGILTCVVFAPTMELLKEYTDTVISECKKASVTCEILDEQQEEGFISTLPLCVNVLKNPRTLKSSSVAIMIPFSNLEIKEKDGINYTMNAVSKNLIIYNRETKINYNGFILGSSGSGKSFTAKTEIINVFLRKNADILILDPEQEYVYLTSKLGGQVIPIMPGGKYHINPLDITSLDYEFDESSITGDVVDPIMEKVSFIMKLFETMLNKSWGMDSIQKTLIDECLRSLYAPFMENGRLSVVPAPEETPTLNDMMDWFAASKEPEAREIYFTLRRYAGEGTLNLFSKHTNVELHNRIVCFDISAVGDELKLMTMNIIQDAMWSRLVENRRIGKFTYIYVDECHLFFQPGAESSAEFLTALWKRARKYGGVPTGITQNTADMVDHPAAKKLLSECNFVQVLNQQSDESRMRLKETLNLSESSLDFITSAPVGQGLFFTGTNTVPFFSRFPKDNAIYPLLTSNAQEILAIKEQERREKLKLQNEEKMKMYNQ